MKRVIEKIDKGLMDVSQYRFIQLDNDLKVVLITDSRSATAACSLYISSGSMYDTPDCPGLAHALEHMVFQGTEEYPIPNHFGEFIKKNGGSKAGITTDDY